MGWFDGDSSSDDEKKPQQRQHKTTREDNAAPNNNKNDNDEEEDPLDAFMSNLSAPLPAASTAAAAAAAAPARRMDLEPEQEDLLPSTDITTNNQHSTASSSLQEELVKEDDPTSNDHLVAVMNHNARHEERARQARKALDATFLPAGAATKRNDDGTTNQNGNGDEDDDAAVNPHDWSRVGVPQLSTATMSLGTKYTAVRKSFWNPTHSPQGAAWRREHDVHCSASPPIDPILSFDALRPVLTDGVWQTIVQQPGYVEPTLVQSQTLPVALAGHDVLVTAATGQGKTLAYLWPMVVHILDQPHLNPENNETGPIGLVLVPTRELAVQVHKYAKTLLAADGGTCKTIIGGQGKYLLYQEIKKSGGGIEIAVATPGRLLDVLSSSKKKNGLTLERTTVVVLDEADKMLHMGFEAQVRQILQALRPDRQTFLLSATMGRRIENVAKAWLQPNYVRIAVGKSGESSEHVEQHVMVLPNLQAKISFLVQMLPTFSSVGRAIVFVATRDGCESLAKTIREQLDDPNSVTLDTLHGDKHQSHRTSTLRAFTKGEISILIATDVAGRGLDVPQVATVVNFDPAKNLDAHVHRVGRAGRLSKQGEQQKGSAYTLLTPKDSDFAHVLRNSFVREHREVSAELQKLADTSRKAGSSNIPTTKRTPINRAGLGFETSESPSSAPPPKRSRWH